MTDQHRAGLTAADGFTLDTMPFTDSLFASGTRFQRAYTTAPACVPARTSLLTGRWPSTHRVRQNSATHEVIRGDDLLDVLRRAGYEVHFNGKPHMYRGKQDFDSFAGPYGHERGPDTTDEQRAFAGWLTSIDHGPATEPTPFPLEVQFPYRIVSDAISALDGRDTDKPFFSWVSFPEPHNPFQVPEPYFSLFGEEQIPERGGGPEAAYAKGGMFEWLRELIEEKRPGYDEFWRRYRANYCGMLRLLDDQIRRLVEHLDGRGLLANTIIMFVADHGDYFADYGLQRKGAGVPEPLMRIPFHAVGPGIVDHDNAVDFVSLADLFPTVCEAVGQDVPLGVQGRSLWPLLTGDDYPREEFDSVYAEHGYGGIPYAHDARPPLHFPYEGTTFDGLNSVTQSGSTRMLRHGDWKLTYDNVGRGELYDLASDPLELDDLWDDPGLRDVRTDLVERLLWWSTRLTDDLPDANYEPRRAPHNWYAPFHHRGERHHRGHSDVSV
ncbi:sulfatase-like hydrolase/transferase [Phytoactinopolyspora halotolerans]|uniref:Sulfatase-like hydrolase/transferase n=2 Tax=Phytoactinopolyspora halotolerans TaxID=1981512 RepID=A0A6L9S4Y3_9ACTN|nr:sulfatase-like hydrolase/transferase [Phytoactinopolyspora halotolerans]